eukprot:TRINITY_DN1819_c0_g1_i2.p1 TRINITY_DN1819_c0_g1~~TRINITY_DN1819_c0_g1_i2.p1  ORF type:complete len:328 (+),score=52.94 TRINITY_DN1819_c0_g1_i2:60-1043(+)
MNKLQHMKETVNISSKDLKEKGQKDVENLSNWLVKLGKAIMHLYVVGLMNSTVNMFKTHIITQSFKSNFKIKLPIVLILLPILCVFLKEYLYEWLYFAILITLNEFINYSIVTHVYSKQFSLSKLADFMDNLIDTEELKKKTDKVKKIFKKEKSDDGEEKPKEEKLTKQQKQTILSKLIGKIIVAKLLSYFLVWNYLEEIIGLILQLLYIDPNDPESYLSYLFYVPVYSVMFSYFIAENRLVLVEHKKFDERMDYIQKYFFYLFGHGTVMMILFLFVPYGELYGSFYHILLLITTQFKLREETDKIVDIDLVVYLEFILGKIISYFI